jgi:hypothetical protein
MTTRAQPASGGDAPTLREYIEAKFAAIEGVIDERDKQYDLRFRSSDIAVAAALAAQEKAVAAAFLASEKAIVKAETAQHDYNDRSNEFRGQLDDQAKMLMPRAETVALLKSLEEKLTGIREAMEKSDGALAADIKSLRESRSAATGGSEAARYMVGLALVVGGVVVGALSRFLH